MVDSDLAVVIRAAASARFVLGDQPDILRTTTDHGGLDAQEVLLSGIGSGGSPRPGLEPYLIAQTTWGSDAHLGAPAMRTRPPAHPVAWQRLASAPSGRPWHSGARGVVGSDPPVRGPGTGSGAGGFAHPCPRPLGSLPNQRSLRGKAVRAPLRGGGAPILRPDRGCLFRRCSRPQPGGGPPRRRSSGTGSDPVPAYFADERERPARSASAPEAPKSANPDSRPDCRLA